MEPLVFLPGMMCDGRLFGPQVAALSGHHPITMMPMTRGDSIEAIARQVVAAAPPRFALLGLSMGGIVAMELARLIPERITRLCLMDTNPMPETPSKKAEREPQIIRVQAGRLREVMGEEMKPNYLAPGPQRADVLRLVMEMAETLGPEVFVRQSRALQKRPDQQRTLRTLKIPTLVMCGRDDRLCPVQRHEFIAHLIPKARLEVIEEAGHLPVLEQPEVVNEILADWLAEPLVLR